VVCPHNSATLGGVKSKLVELAGTLRHPDFIPECAKEKLRPRRPENLAACHFAPWGAPVAKMDDVKIRAGAHGREEISEPVIVAWDWKSFDYRIASYWNRHPPLVLENGTEIAWPPPKRLADGLSTNSTTVSSSSAPTRAHFPISGKAWGVLAPVLWPAFQTQRRRAGDLTDLESVVDWMDEHGGQVGRKRLPLLSAFLDKTVRSQPVFSGQPDVLERALH